MTPDLSGFESLKSSGFLNQLQGTDLEKILFDYYNQVDQLTTKENNYNASIQNAREDFFNAGLEGTLAFFSPGTKNWKAEMGREYDAIMENIVQHPTMMPVYLWPDYLLVAYDKLLITGNVLLEMINNGQMTFSQENSVQLAQVYDEYDEIPYAKVMRSGGINNGYSYAAASANNNEGVNIQYLDGFSALQFYDEPWAVAYFYVGEGVVDPYRVKDFTAYKILRLKLRGTQGGEQIQVALKDISNPTDGSETKVSLTLTDEWKTYDIPLSSFTRTRLEELFLFASFIVENQALTIEVESIEYIR